jgi:hypothetical protein
MNTIINNWWTAGGWAEGVIPVPHAEMLADPTETDWQKLLSKAGYTLRAKGGDEFDIFEIEVWWHKPDYFYVNIMNMGEGISDFFVAMKDKDAFFADWYPKFIYQTSIPELRSELYKLVKTAIAFTRYGQSEKTIDRSGLYSYDDHLDFLELKRQRATEKRKNAQTKQ